MLFVQVGETEHHHPALRGVLDLRGRTDLRQLVRLVHHAQGVLCRVTLAMHLAAALEVRGGVRSAATLAAGVRWAATIAAVSCGGIFLATALLVVLSEGVRKLNR